MNWPALIRAAALSFGLGLCGLPATLLVPVAGDVACQGAGLFMGGYLGARARGGRAWLQRIGAVVVAWLGLTAAVSLRAWFFSAPNYGPGARFIGYLVVGPGLLLIAGAGVSVAHLRNQAEERRTSELAR